MLETRGSKPYLILEVDEVQIREELRHVQLKGTDPIEVSVRF